MRTEQLLGHFGTPIRLCAGYATFQAVSKLQYAPVRAGLPSKRFWNSSMPPFRLGLFSGHYRTVLCFCVGWTSLQVIMELKNYYNKPNL